MQLVNLWLKAGIGAALCICSFTACTPNPTSTTLPTANVRVQSAIRPTAIPTTEQPAAQAEASLLDPTPAAASTVEALVLPTYTPTPASAEEQYRLWMEEARAAHPYAESTEQMYAVMMCESRGQPEVSNGTNIGLFQYDPNTWVGDWNPYRDAPITDPRSQIFATAKAWQDGHQGWWGCYG